MLQPRPGPRNITPPFIAIPILTVVTSQQPATVYDKIKPYMTRDFLIQATLVCVIATTILLSGLGIIITIIVVNT